MTAAVKRAYIICTTPRSGSTMLCKLLEATGVAGHPDSHFHEPSLARWRQSFDIPNELDDDGARKAVFSAAVQRGSGQGDVFGLRLQRDSAAFFFHQLALLHPHAPSDNARLNAAFGRCSLIHLQRDDTLNQAISLLRAEQTGLWHRNADGSELEREAPRREAGYDRAAISAHIDRISQQNREWAAWFKEEGLRPLHLSYEKLSAAPGHELAHVFAHIGLDPAHAENVSTQTSRLADDVSANWRARYLAEDRL